MAVPLASALPRHGLDRLLHLPLAAGVTSVQLDPFEWVQAPVLLLEEISRESGTLRLAPELRVQPDGGPDPGRRDGRDIPRVRENDRELQRTVCGQSLEKFQARFERFGLRPGSLAACYAMAETTFAVTQTRPWSCSAEIRADRAALAKGRSSSRPTPSRLGDVSPPVGRSKDVSSGSLAKRRERRGRNRRRDRDPVNVPLLRIPKSDGEDGGSALWRLVSKRRPGLCPRGRDVRHWTSQGHHHRRGEERLPEDVEDAVSSVEGVLPGRVVAFPGGRRGTRN